MRHRTLARLALASVVLLTALTTRCRAEAHAPDRREEATDQPHWHGTTANAPIPPHEHKRNEGGSDGAGLCVICSLYINGTYQGIPRDALDRMWRLAKSRPGGYSPDKLQALLDEVVPGEKWASYVGTDASVLDRLNAMGYPIGATMNTGELYNWQPIHHMVSLVHFDEARDIACVVDNNRPGVYCWMSAREYKRRWIDGGTGWAFVWLRKAKSLPGSNPVETGIALGAVAFVAVLAIRSRLADRTDPFAPSGDEPDLDDEEFP